MGERMMKLRLKILIVCGLFWTVPSGTMAQEGLPVDSSAAEPGQKTTWVDSLLREFSLEELIKFREFYQNEVRLFEREERLLRYKGIRDGEKIYALNPQSPFMDKVLFRLAEYYFQKAREDYFRAMEKYEEEFRAFEEGRRDHPPDEPKPDYSRVIEKYKLILTRFPESSLMDDVLYRLGYALEQNGQADSAVTYYQQLVQQFPESKYVPEAYIRLGEYYFDPVRRDLDKAIACYSQVLRFKDTPRYDEALYKLGWSYYLKEQFTEAIQYFTLLVQNIERMEELDPNHEYSNPTLKEEALEYIGICFHDAGGLPAALAFLDSLGRPEYGPAILKKMGEIYQKYEEKYLLAIQTYRALLERYPYYEGAPEVYDRIVQCAVKLEEPEEVYLAQKELFERFRPGSEWEKVIRERIKHPVRRRKVLKDAFMRAEQAERENVNLLIRLAQEKDDLRYYELAVKEAMAYLEAFPYDTSAYTIHWNLAVILDTKLHRREEALQAYLDVCNNYLQDRFRKYAAENAIVVAKELDQLARESDTLKLAGDTLSTMEKLKKMAEGGAQNLFDLKPIPLRESEKLLIEAYRNYVIHFPHEPESAIILANIGTIYYNKHHFDEALQYFHTLLAHFPDSPAATQAQITVLDSYFGKRDYASTELLAKRIQAKKELPPEVLEKARRRLAESIYLQAEALAGEGKHLEAAREYRRVIEEVPDALFADKALFQAGVQFDLAKAFDQSIEVYQQLVERFPKSEHYLDALNNLALDYAELKKFDEAALAYERLAHEHPDSAKAQDALYNASYFYVQARDWANAIRINREYVDRYPNAPDAEDMFYNIAGYYLKMDNYDAANEIYAEFARRYPDSPRSVETYYRRGEYFLRKGRLADAFREFDLALAKNEELKKRNLPANDFYAAEALFARSQEEFKEYRAIRFTLANKEQAQKRKKELLQKLVKQYTQVAGFGTIRIYESLYRIGQLYEEFALAWNEQEIPPMSETERIVYESKLKQTSAQLFEKAFETYKKNLLRIRNLMASYKPQVPDTTGGKSIRVAPQDTTLQVAQVWLEKTENKVSETLYNIAELNYGAIERLLNAPIPEGLDEVAVLEYRNQLLAKAVFPIVREITDAHIRNLVEADSLKLENRWVEQSRRKLIEVARILPDQYRSLCLDASRTFERLYREYNRIMREGTEEEQEGALDLAGKLSNVIEMSKNYANLMLANYKFTIDRLKPYPFGKLLAQSLFSEMMQASVVLAERFVEFAQDNRIQKDYFTVQNQIEPKMVYEDAIFTYSDNETQLKDNALALCETVYDLKKSYGFPSPHFARLAALMVHLDPQTYAQEFDLPETELAVAPDKGWMATTEYPDSTFMVPERLETLEWHPASVRRDVSGEEAVPALIAYESFVVERTEPAEEDTATAPAPDSLLATASADTSAGADSLRAAAGDTLLVSLPADTSSAGIEDFAEPEPVLEARPASRFVVARSIYLEDIPLSATLKLNADDNAVVYLNGIKVFAETSDSLGWGDQFETDITPFLRPGKNWLVIEIEDTDQSGMGVQPILNVKVVDKTALLRRQEELASQEYGGQRSLDELVFHRFIVPEM
jgi:TolA-binding protein